jgi:helicase
MAEDGIDFLRDYGVPEEIISKLREEKIHKLYPPQVAAIKAGAIEGKSLVLSMPTASGKTLVATLASIGKLQKGRKVVYICPLVALAGEKYDYYKKLFDKRWKVAISVGELDSSDAWLTEYDFIICTTEKLDSLIRHGAPWVKELGLVIIDEVHMLNDPSRGPTLEVLITQLKELLPHAQTLAFSATINNADELAEWLGCKLVASDFRPVKLHEGFTLDGKIKFLDKDSYELPDGETEKAILQNTLGLDKQVIFFVSTRRNAESLADNLAIESKKKLTKIEKAELEKVSNEILNVLESPTKQCRKIAVCVKGGSAFHHAGLLHKQKKLIEDGFRSGIIKSIVATPTLCLHPETVVFTKNGAKMIKELNHDHKALTHKGNFKAVIRPLKTKFKGELLALKPHGGVEVKMTPGHKVLTIKETRHKSHYYNGTQKIWWEHGKPFWVKASQLHNLLKSNNDKKVSYYLLQPIPIPKTNNDRILIKNGPSYICNQFGRTSKIHHADKRTPNYLRLDYEFSRLLGVWAAEGSVSNTGAVIFNIASYEEALTKFITAMIRKNFPLSKISIKDHERHRRSIVFCNKFFARWLKKNIGSNAHDKMLPGILFLNKNRSVRLGVVRGLVEGDGYTRIDNEKRSSYVSYSSVSPSLAFQLQGLLASLGFVSGLSRRQNKRWGKFLLYSVIISGDSYYRLLDAMDIKGAKRGNRTYNINKILGNYLLLKIVDIKKSRYAGPVYNLSIEDDESYSVGFAVHNSMGVNLPAFRVVIRDIRRYYSGLGMSYIPVLDYKQFVGRAGRPQYDSFGESILIAKSEHEADELVERFVLGEPEKIRSKLAMEPVLRMHTLSLVANAFAGTEKALYDFFGRTFYAFQYGDTSAMEEKIESILEQLDAWGFITGKGGKLAPTRVGKRVAELYLDPLTAHNFIEALKYAKGNVNDFGLMHTIASAAESAPQLSVRAGEYEKIMETINERERLFMQHVPEHYELEFEFFMHAAKTAMLLDAWANEKSEDEILAEFKVAPGELNGKMAVADWLVYSINELALLLGMKDSLSGIRRLRLRLKYGIREELVPLVRLKGIGRVRSRRMFNAGLKTLEDLRKVPMQPLSRLIGPTVAYDVKKQLGQETEKPKSKSVQLKLGK